MVKYKELVNLSKPGIIILETKFNKKCLLVATDNILKYVSSLIDSLNSRKHNCQELIRNRNKLRMSILETGVSDRYSLNYWHNFYTKLGYSFYNSYKPLSLILKLRIDYRYGAMVELSNKANKAFVVGVFKTLKEATEWVDRYYLDLDHIEPIYATNLETRNYYNGI